MLEHLPTLPPHFFDSAQRIQPAVTRSVSTPQRQVNVRVAARAQAQPALFPGTALAPLAVAIVVFSVLFAYMYKRESICRARHSFGEDPSNDTVTERGHLVPSSRDTEAEEGEGQFRFDPSQFRSL